MIRDLLCKRVHQGGRERTCNDNVHPCERVGDVDVDADYLRGGAVAFNVFLDDLRHLGCGVSDGEEAAETALRFTLGQDGVHTAIVGTTNLEHCRQNAAMLNAGPLPDTQVQAIRERWKAVEASLPQ